MVGGQNFKFAVEKVILHEVYKFTSTKILNLFIFYILMSLYFLVRGCLKRAVHK